MRSLTVIALVLLAGCQSAPRPAPPSASAENPATRTVVFRAQAFSETQVPLPSGARLDVLLIDDRGDVVTAQSFEDVHALPHAIELRVDAARAGAAGPLALRGALRDGAGHLVFFSDRRVAIARADAANVPLRLVLTNVPKPRR